MESPVSSEIREQQLQLGKHTAMSTLTDYSDVANTLRVMTGATLSGYQQKPEQLVFLLIHAAQGY